MQSSSSSDTSLPEPGPRQSALSQSIAKYTIASSLAGGILAAAYESTRGRARAIRELEAQADTANLRNVDGNPAARTSAMHVRSDAAKLYRHNTALLSAAAALNSGLVAFAFFSLREHLVSPALLKARKNGDTEQQTLTWSAMRTYHLEDTALTGALLGGAFNAWKKGPKGIFPGAFTASLACTALQFVVNELDVQRVRYVSRTSASSNTSAPLRSIPQAPPHDQTSLQNSLGNATTSSTDASSSTDTQGDERPGLGERMLALVGITKVDDTEYLRRLKAKREKHLARIRELEVQIERERRVREAQVPNAVNSKPPNESRIRS